MENLNDRIEELALLEFNEKEQKRLEHKYKDVTSVQAFEGFINGCKKTMNGLSFFSLILGFGIALMFYERMPSIAPFAFALGFGLVAVVEYGKRWNLDRFNTLRIVNKSKKHPINLRKYIVASISLLCASILFSFVGSPYIVKQFAKHKPLISVDSIIQDFSNQIAFAENHWNGLKEEYQKKAVQIHQENSWKGKTSRDARKPKLQMELKSSEMQDSLNSAVSYLTKLQDTEIRLAKEQNKAILENHNSWCFNFGYFGSLCALLIDLLLIVLAFVVANHEETKITENRKRKELILSLQQENQTRKEKRTEKKTEKKKEPEFQQVAETENFAETEKKSIQIAVGKKKEGAFDMLEGEKVVFLEMKKGPRKGELIPKTEQQIVDLVNNASNPNTKRTIFLKELLKQF